VVSWGKEKPFTICMMVGFLKKKWLFRKIVGTLLQFLFLMLQTMFAVETFIPKQNVVRVDEGSELDTAVEAQVT